MSNKDEILKKKIDKKELKRVSGGSCGKESGECVKRHQRDIYCINSKSDTRISYYTDFPNCAATVESGSLCGKNDACYNLSVVYHPFKTCACHKAWE